MQISLGTSLSHTNFVWCSFCVFRMRMRTILFVVLSQIQRATMTNWGLEEDLKPVAHVREIVQKLLVCVRTARSDHEYILHLQSDMANLTWRFNHLDESRKRYDFQQ
ncbi:uncharacterized protein LOC124170027 [Ischnura elegans]|uniref:uncharacterized protein LOC124170027 n=1 Tax=Ischnura elegans TaxID=197161 RepID=UPI001ED8A328|nr:uncharacterized protein LOC124170027 [Ischnura elegans]